MVNVGLELDDDVAVGLYHLRDNRNVDLSVWVQGLIQLGLPAELQNPADGGPRRRPRHETSLGQVYSSVVDGL